MGEKFRQHRCITHAVAGDLDGPDLHGLGVNRQMYFPPLAMVVSTMLLRFLFALAEHLHSSTIHTQVSCIALATATIGDGNLQVLLTPRNSAEIRNRTVLF